MFKVGDKYKLVDPDGAMMFGTPEGTILEVVGIEADGDALVKGHHLDGADFISNTDVEDGYVVKTTSVGELHMDVTFDTTDAREITDVREILCRAAEQIHDKTGIRIEEIDFSWTDKGDGPYIHSIHIEGGA